MPASLATIRLFMADDHALFRDGLARLLAADPGFELVGVASTIEDALAGLARHEVDVLLLDYMFGDRPADTMVATLRDRGFTGRILLVTAGLPDREARRMIAAGVAGIFHKQRAAEDLTRSIREVHDGKVLIDEHYLRQLVQVASADDSRTLRFTDRERQILTFLMEGLANKEMASELRISESAVKAALQVLFNKTGVRTRSQLVRVALEQFGSSV
ncbi:MAG: LuxR C-terminal-related transcriptional regulator [Vicinamibacterales bacterium]